MTGIDELEHDWREQQHSPRTVTAPTPRALWEVHPCELVSYHAPLPSVTEYHHQKPVFLQNRLYGKILYGPSLWVCSNCHDSIHAWLYWLLGERKSMPRVGHAAKTEAEHTYLWFLAEQKRLSPTPNG